MKSIFAEQRTKLFQTTAITVEFRNRLVGGCPKDPKLVQGWLGTKLGITDEVEMIEKMKSHLREMGQTVPANATYQDLMSGIEKISEDKTQGFKRDRHGNPYIESRQIKAGIKEQVNILYAGQRWGPTKKGPKNFTAERVFVAPERIAVGTNEDVLVDLSIGHLTGPNGPVSTLGYYEYVERATMKFYVMELRAQNTPGQEPALDFDQWGNVWSLFEQGGLGSMRSQGFGQFDVVGWESVETAPEMLEDALAREDDRQATMADALARKAADAAAEREAVPVG